jgi:nucleoredoxin
MVTITPVDENNKDVFSIESLLGPTLLKDVKGSPVSTAKEALKSNKSGIVALYFSASWCPPCQRFTPILIDFYNAAKEAKCGFEIVFVSSDRGTEEFEKYVSANEIKQHTNHHR